MSKRITVIRTPHAGRPSRRLAVSSGLLIASISLAGCGQTGPLYLPEDAGKVIIREAGDTRSAPSASPTRPTQSTQPPTPPATQPQTPPATQPPG
jgi:predicted small lipoprotein YifL